MLIHLIFCRAALVNGHGFDLVPVALLVDRPGMIFSFELHTTVFQHLLVVLPGSKVEDFFQFAFSFNISGRRFIASSQHVIHMEDENTNQFWEVALKNVLIVEHEATWIQLVSLPVEGFQTSQSFQVPSSRSVDLPINWLLQKHPGVRAGAQNLQCLCRQFQPQ